MLAAVMALSFPVGITYGVLTGSFLPPEAVLLRYGAVEELYQLTFIVCTSLPVVYGAYLILLGNSHGLTLYVIGYCIPHSICLGLLYVWGFQELLMVSAAGIYLPVILCCAYVRGSKSLQSYFARAALLEES